MEKDKVLSVFKKVLFWGGYALLMFLNGVVLWEICRFIFNKYENNLYYSICHKGGCLEYSVFNIIIAIFFVIIIMFFVVLGHIKFFNNRKKLLYLLGIVPSFLFIQLVIQFIYLIVK